MSLRVVFMGSPEFAVPTLRAVAQVRASTRVKTPDAMQLAAAMAAGCPVFLTNDDRIPSLQGLRTLVLEDYLPQGS